MATNITSRAASSLVATTRGPALTDSYSDGDTVDGIYDLYAHSDSDSCTIQGSENEEEGDWFWQCHIVRSFHSPTLSFFLPSPNPLFTFLSPTPLPPKVLSIALNLPFIYH